MEQPFPIVDERLRIEVTLGGLNHHVLHIAFHEFVQSVKDVLHKLEISPPILDRPVLSQLTIGRQWLEVKRA